MKEDEKSKIDNENIKTTSVCPSSPAAQKLYRNAWKLFKHHIISNSVFISVNAFTFDGSMAAVEKIASLPRCTIPDKKIGEPKPGIFISRQPSIKVFGQAPSIARIASYTNLVVEFDDGSPVEEQISRVKLSKFPYSVITFSGNKSVHINSVLESDIGQARMREYSEILMRVFPRADKTVLKNLQQYFRFPIVSENYNQPLIEFNGKVQNKIMEAWMNEHGKRISLEDWNRGLPDFIQNAQKRLREYQDVHGGKNRMPCPVCIQRGRKSTRDLQIEASPEGRLLFHCFRCIRNKKYAEALKEYFLSTKKKKRGKKVSPNDPNRFLNAFHNTINSTHFFHQGSKSWFIRGSLDSPLLHPLSDDDLQKSLWKLYERLAKLQKRKVSNKDFFSLLGALCRRQAMDVRGIPLGQVVLEDGSLLDIEKGTINGKYSHLTDFWVPLTASQWNKPPNTPHWDKFLDAHASTEDQLMLMRFLGYVFSGCPVIHQQCLLIIHGPSDTGKSLIRDFVLKTLPHHAESMSITRCLSHPIFAARIRGKRVGVSSEAAIRAKDGEKFRALISGEELFVKILYRGEETVSHNAVFIAATNETGFIENNPENRKRIRVIHWDNPVSENKMDFKLLDKLLSEKEGIICKSLRAFAPFIGKRLPTTKSTETFMRDAGEHINPISAWLTENNIKVGDKFSPTNRIRRKFITDTDERMAYSEFGRKLAKALGQSARAKGLADGRQVRGFNLSEHVS